MAWQGVCDSKSFANYFNFNLKKIQASNRKKFSLHHKNRKAEMRRIAIRILLTFEAIHHSPLTINIEMINNKYCSLNCECIKLSWNNEPNRLWLMLNERLSNPQLPNTSPASSQFVTIILESVENVSLKINCCADSKVCLGAAIMNWVFWVFSI